MKKLLLCLMVFAIINTAQSQSWLIGGNSNINPAIHFLGTTNNQPLKFRINNQYAGEMDSTGTKTFFGYGAGKNTTGSANVGVGFKTLNANTTGLNNTAIGANSLFSNTTGAYNCANGTFTLYNNTTGGNNTVNGYKALYSNTTGYQNTANGMYALYSNTTATYNVASGYAALYSNTTGYQNTANGYGSLYSNTTGKVNTANGSYALFLNTTGYDNVANGYSALYSNTTGNFNTANGDQALNSNTTGYYNVANGYQALYSNTTAPGNTATGVQSLYWNTIGNNNTATGSLAMYHNTTGIYNTATGVNALFSNTSGFFNTADGYAALISNITGSYNTAVGKGALGGTLSNYNTGIGYNTLGSTININSQYNTAVGSAAGDGFDNGSLNVFVGEESDATAAGLSNVIAVGQGTMVAASNTARFGNSGTTSYGGYANWTNISDGRYKKNIKENVPGLEFINKLRPVTYNLDASGLDAFLHKNNKEELSAEAKSIYERALSEKEKTINTGFIAQEVEAAAKEIGYDFSGVDAAKNENDVYGLRYAEFVVPLVKGMQEQQVMIEELKKQNAELLSRVTALEKNQHVIFPQQDNGLDVRPNPSADKLIVTLVADGMSPVTFRIYDSKGALVKQQSLKTMQGSNQFTIDINELMSGIYLVSAEWNNGRVKKTTSIIKQ